MDERQNVNISIGRYTELLELEIRVNILVERIEHKEYLDTEDLLWALGTANSVEMAQKMRDEKVKAKEEKNACKEESPQ